VDTSRSLREALRRLEGVGLVTFRPRHGAVVAAVSAIDMWEVLEMRAALESIALREAIRNRTPESIAALRAAIPDDATPNWIGENREFHMAHCRPCARPRLLASIEELCLASERYVALLDARTDYPGNQRQQHRAILAHVEAGRTARAVRQLKEDILGGGSEILEVIDGRFDPAQRRR
jgi:DNA-binding GntR family transcriptional regulator